MKKIILQEIFNYFVNWIKFSYFLNLNFGFLNIFERIFLSMRTRVHFPKQLSKVESWEMYILNQSKSVEHFQSQVETLKVNWNATFAEYFVKHIQPAFLNNFSKLEDRQFQHFLKNNITSNLSESLRSLMKNFISNKRGKLRAD